MTIIQKYGMLMMLLCVGACASTAGIQGNTQTYLHDIETVAQAANTAFVNAGLEVEETRWINDTTYVIAGFRRSEVLRSAGQGIQVSSAKVYVTKLSDFQTEVRVETSQRNLPAAASSADRGSDDIRKFFSRLNAQLER
jgi:hypothetical protein